MERKARSGEKDSTNEPLSLDRLTVQLIVSSLPNESSKVQYVGYICRRNWFDSGKEDQWSYFWAVVRAGHLFLFRNAQPTAVCQDAHMLCQYYFDPMQKKLKWPKGMLYCKLRSRCDITVSLPTSQGDLELGWSELYRWERLLRDSVSAPEGKSQALDESARQQRTEALLEYRKLMIALRSFEDSSASASGGAVNEVYEDDFKDFFESDDLPLPTRAPKQLLGMRLGKSKLNSYSESPNGSLPRQPQQERLQRQPLPQQPPPAMVAEDNIYDDASASGPAAVPAEAEDEYLAPDVPQEPRPQLQQLRQQPPQQPPQQQQLQLRQQLTKKPQPQEKPRIATATAAASEATSYMAEVLANGQPAEASVRYFLRAYQNPAGQAQEAIANLNGKQRGSFIVVGYVSSRPRKVFVLYVQTGRRVATYQVCEQSRGFRVMPTDLSHGTMSQLLYHYHVYELPTTESNPETGLRLTRPADGEEKFSFHCSAAWTLGDRALCQKLLTGTPTGTFAIVSDAITTRFYLYASREGQVVKMLLETSGGKIWAQSDARFSSLEELLVHYHRQELKVSVVGSGQDIGIRLVTPCQLSEQFTGNTQRYLTQQIEEETMELPAANSGGGGGGPSLVETRRLGPVSVRSESGGDLTQEPVPILQVSLSKKYEYKGPIDVTPCEFRCFNEVFSVRRCPEMAFDSLDKLMLYVWSHHDKLC